MKWQITNVKYLDGYRLLIDFKDGSSKCVDLSPHIHGEVFERLKDIEYFKTVQLNPELESIYWDNGADFAPEFLYENGVPVQDSSRIRG